MLCSMAAVGGALCGGPVYNRQAKADCGGSKDKRETVHRTDPFLAGCRNTKAVKFVTKSIMAVMWHDDRVFGALARKNGALFTA